MTEQEKSPDNHDEATNPIAILKELDLYRNSIINLHDRVLKLEKGYSDLCGIHDKWKQLHFEIGTKQKKHIDTCDKNFLKIKESIDNLMRRL